MSIAEPAGAGWRAVLAEMGEGAREAIRRFPVTAAALFVLALYANLEIAGAALLEDSDVLLAALFAAACASVAVHFFCEARDIRSPAKEIAALCCGALAFAAVHWQGWTGTYVWAFVLALAALPLVAPFLGRGTGAAFWLFGVRTAFAVLLAGLALVLFAGGVTAFLASLAFLFGLETPDELYGHVWATTGLFAAPLFGLGQLPRDFASEPDAGAQAFMDRGMRALGDFVAAPLFLLYAAVLHLYALKILLIGETPEGEIGWLVLGFGFCTVGSLILIHPFGHAARAPTRLFLRIWPYLLAVPLILLFYAVALRIGEYGITPDRYLLAVFGLVLAGLIALQIFSPTRGDIRYLAAIPVLALLFASFGPQGALKTSIRSQTARFEALVAERPLQGARHDQALSALRFLLWNGAVANVTPEDMAVTAEGEPKADDALFREIAAAYGIDPDITLSPDASFARSYAQPAAFPTSEFDLVVPSITLFKDADAQAVALPAGGMLQLQLDGNAVVATYGEEQVRFPVTAEQIGSIASVSPPVPDRAVESPVEPLLLEQGSRRLAIVPTNIYGQAGEAPSISNISGAILLRSSDWR